MQWAVLPFAGFPAVQRAATICIGQEQRQQAQPPVGLLTSVISSVGPGCIH